MIVSRLSASKYDNRDSRSKSHSALISSREYSSSNVMLYTSFEWLEISEQFNFLKCWYLQITLSEMQTQHDP